MGGFIIIFPFFLFCFLWFPLLTESVQDCSINQCGKDEPVISYPFRIKDRQSKSCGHPGFDLTCDNLNRTVLELPSSGRFFVQYISYGRTSNDIQLRDPDNCLPRRILNHLDLSGTPFIDIDYTNYSFFSCASAKLSSSSYSLDPISCLSNSTHKVFIATSVSYRSLWNNYKNCRLIATVPVFSYVSVLHLTWNWKEPWCKQDCKKKSNYPSFRSPDVPSGTRRRKIILGTLLSLFIGLSILITFLCCYCTRIVVCFHGICVRRHSRHSAPHSHRVTVPTQPVVVPQPTVGLTDSVIKSYPEVILGESRRFPNPNDTTCAVCLSDFQPKERLKCMPMCNHCFHANCLEQWLRVNATCPICRMCSLP